MEPKPDKKYSLGNLVNNDEIIITPNTMYYVHNNLNEAHYFLTDIEHKIILFVISLIKKEDSVLKRYVISFNKLAETLNIRLYNLIRSILPLSKTLIERSLEIYNKEKDEYDLFNWISHININKKESLFTIQLNNNIQEYVVKLKLKEGEFTSSNILKLMSLRGIYAGRLYNFCIQYQNMKNPLLKVIRFRKTITEIKALFGIQKNKSYDRLDNLKNKVIEKARLEILNAYNNNCINIYFTYSNIKEGRRVIGFWFTIYKRLSEKTIQKIKV